MNGLAMFLGMSLSFGGVGILETVLLLMTSRFAPGFILIAIFRGLVWWFAVGRFSARRRASKAAAVEATANK